LRAAALLRRALVGLLCGLIALSALADGACRAAYDLGSSGIRLGTAAGATVAHAELDALGLLSGRRDAEDAVAATVAAFRALQNKLALDPACRQLGGGFSAWRLALARDPVALAQILARIHAASGVPIVVIPQTREGSYGYQGARLLLGARLRSTHVLDIGGGSLQVAGEHAAFGAALGQKLWQAELCRVLGRPAPCTPQPLSRNELAAARALADERLHGLRTAFPAPVTLTAISRPVSRGVRPALAQLGLAAAAAETIALAAVTQAIERLSGRGLDETMALSGSAMPHAAYLFSDLLLLEGLLRATGGISLRVAEIDLTNIPGLLADERAYAWGGKYACYLDRLKTDGLQAYAGDPAGCD